MNALTFEADMALQRVLLTWNYSAGANQPHCFPSHVQNAGRFMQPEPTNVNQKPPGNPWLRRCQCARQYRNPRIPGYSIWVLPAATGSVQNDS
jgi:hypothetical protein